MVVIELGLLSDVLDSDRAWSVWFLWQANENLSQMWQQHQKAAVSQN